MKRKHEPQGLDLPDTVDLESVNAAEIAVVRLAAQGRIDVREALFYSRMLEHRRRAIGDRTLEEQMTRIEELRQAQAKGRARKP
jgi:hypothetical protein